MSARDETERHEESKDVQVEFTVELEAGDEVLEIPWASEDGSIRYHDLRHDPELISEITEAAAHPALKDFLLVINSGSIFFTAKCDAWFSRDLNPEEQILGTCKYGGYVDLVLADPHSAAADLRASFGEHEKLLKALVRELASTADIPASAEFIVRRCYFHDPAGEREGLYITLYMFGYGSDEHIARGGWEQALRVVQGALLKQRAPSA
jgi:hypothetical protein